MQKCFCKAPQFFSLTIFNKKLQLKASTRIYTLEIYFVHCALYTRPAQHLNVIYFTESWISPFIAFEQRPEAVQESALFSSLLLIQSSAVGPVSAVSRAERTFPTIETIFFSKKPALEHFFRTIMSILTWQLRPIRVENFIGLPRGDRFWRWDDKDGNSFGLCAAADFSGLKIGEKLFSLIWSKQQQLAVTKGWAVKFSEKISDIFSRDGCWWDEVKTAFW